MEDARTVADRIRPILKAMERSIDSARSRRTNAAGPMPSSTQPPLTARDAAAAKNPHAPAAQTPAAHPAQPARPASPTHPAHPGSAAPGEPAQNPPARPKARPKRPGGNFGAAASAQRLNGSGNLRDNADTGYRTYVW